MISGTSINYTGQAVDLSLFPTIARAGVPAPMQFSTVPRAAAGPSILAQDFARVLLTPTGTWRGDPTMGSDFLANLRSTALQYPSQVQQIYLIAREQALTWMNQHDQNLPPEMRILAADLLTFGISGNSVNLTIQVTSRATTSVTFLLPVIYNF